MCRGAGTDASEGTSLRKAGEGSVLQGLGSLFHEPPYNFSPSVCVGLTGNRTVYVRACIHMCVCACTLLNLPPLELQSPVCLPPSFPLSLSFFCIHQSKPKFASDFSSCVPNLSL